MPPQESTPEPQSAPADTPQLSTPQTPTVPIPAAPAPVPSVQPQPQVPPTVSSQPVAFNPATQQTAPVQAQVQPQPFAQQFQPATVSQEVDAKISNPRYWLTILLVTIIESFLYGLSQPVPAASLLVLVIAVAAIVLSYKFTSKLKAKGVDSLTKDEKYRAVVYITITPLFAASFMYYRLRETMPNTTKLINKLFWKVFLLAVLFAIPLVFFAQALFPS